MAVHMDIYEKHEEEVRELAAKWLNTKDKKVEQKLRKYGFTAWDFLDLLHGDIGIE